MLLFEVDENCAIGLSFAQRKIVYSKHFRSRLFRNLKCSNEPQERIRTHGQPQTFCQVCARISSEHETNGLQPRSAAFGPASIRFDRVSKPFSKRAPGTHHIGANETAHVYFH